MLAGLRAQSGRDEKRSCAAEKMWFQWVLSHALWIFGYFARFLRHLHCNFGRIKLQAVSVEQLRSIRCIGDSCCPDGSSGDLMLGWFSQKWWFAVRKTWTSKQSPEIRERSVWVHLCGFLCFMFNFIAWCSFMGIRSDIYKLCLASYSYWVQEDCLFSAPFAHHFCFQFVHWGFVPRHLFIPIRCARARRRLHAGANSEDLFAFRTLATQIGCDITRCFVNSSGHPSMNKSLKHVKGRLCALTFLHREVWHKELLKPERCICT